MIGENDMILNKRDLGGIKTKDGHEIKPGLLIRSAHLSQAQEADLRGISAVIDLRTPGERREAPDKTYGCRYLPLAVFDESTIGISHESGVSDQWIPAMDILYQRVMYQCTGSFSRIIRTIMGHDFQSGGILWHCTEGKDRCGITTALVLEALGVDRSLIMEDYLKTNLINLPKAMLIRQQLADTRGVEFAESVYQAYIADSKYLEAAWSAMGENYIKTALGIPENTLIRFRETVLE